MMNTPALAVPEWCGPLAESGLRWGVPLAAAGLGLGYVVLAVRQRRRRRGWPGARIAAFLAAMLTLAVAAQLGGGLPGTDLATHAWQHVLVGMWAPVGIVRAAPLTLVLGSVRPGLARRIMGGLRRREVGGLVHPITGYVLGSLLLLPLFLTPGYAVLLERGWGHALLHGHFLAAGVLLTWIIAGQDPSPHRASFRARVILLVASAGTHAFVAKAMYAYGHPRGIGASAEEIQTAAQVMYYAGDLAELALAVILFAGWLQRQPACRTKGSPASRHGTLGIPVRARSCSAG